jgi:hypothetical protein
MRKLIAMILGAGLLALSSPAMAATTPTVTLNAVHAAPDGVSFNLSGAVTPVKLGVPVIVDVAYGPTGPWFYAGTVDTNKYGGYAFAAHLSTDLWFRVYADGVFSHTIEVARLWRVLWHGQGVLNLGGAGLNYSPLFILAINVKVTYFFAACNGTGYIVSDHGTVLASNPTARSGSGTAYAPAGREHLSYTDRCNFAVTLWD